MACIGDVLACIETLLVCIGTELACIGTVLACIGDVLACIVTVFACIWTVGAVGLACWWYISGVASHDQVDRNLKINNHYCHLAAIFKTLNEVAYLTANSNRSANVSSKQTSAISVDEIEINSAAHSQFNMDHEVENENILPARIDLVNCELQKSKHRQAIIAAQYNGWLGAEILGLSKWTKLHAIGTIVQSIQCEIKNVSFSTHVTGCGHQPVYKSIYTISKTGWELVDYNSCYCTANWVNFNGIPHSFTNGTWQPLEYTSISPQVPLHHTFKYVDDTASSFVTHINPAYDMITIDHVNVVADLVAAINEHHQPGVPSPVFVKPDQLSHLNTISIMVSAWSTFFIVVFVIIAIVLIAIVIYFRKTIYMVISCLYTPLRLLFRFIGTQFLVCFNFLKKKKNGNISLSNIRMSDPENSNVESNLLNRPVGYVTPSAPSHHKIYQNPESQSSSALKTESIYPNIFYVTEEEINNQLSVTVD